MHNLKVLFAAGLTALATMASAAPVLIVIDDFSADQGPVSDLTTGDGPVVDVLPGVRTISTNMLSSAVPVGNTVQVVAGILDITNGTGDDSEVILSWDIAAGLIPFGATNVNFTALIIESDGNPTDVEFLLGSTTLLANAIPGNTADEVINFSIDAALIAAGGTLTMKLNGAAGWDLSMDALGISYAPGNPTVPEPASLLLAGLGLMGAGVARRRRKAL